MALGAANAWAAQVTEDCAALSTTLCLCVCAAGLFGEDLPQRGYQRDREVLAYIAASQLATLPELLAPPSVSWPATSTASPATGCRCLMPMARPPLSALTAWLPDLGKRWGKDRVS